MNSFFAYRMPDSKGIKSFLASKTLPGIVPGGFCVCSFDPDSLSIFTIPAETSATLQTIAEEWSNLADMEGLFPYPAVSTSRSDHKREVENIVGLIGIDSRKKVVAARVVLEKVSIDLTELFLALCDRYPSAFVFLFFTPQSGCWIGASPELLLKKSASLISTVALAGTRSVDSPGPWDQKNIEEQRVVSEYICEVLDRYCVNVECSDTYTAKAGPVEHIKNDISGILPSGNEVSVLTELLSDLSPTPALCGYPKREALEIISVNENFSRAYYGGFCGPVNEVGDFSFYVNLRSMWVRHDKTALFVGGGITRFSTPEAEWQETEKKKTTLLF